MTRRYYWLKLKDDFFGQKEIKRLRRLAGGDTYTIIYLKLLLLSLKDEGKIYFDGVGDDFTDELSLEIDEEQENIKITLAYLQSKDLLEIVSENEYFMKDIPVMIGSESGSAKRVRRHREKKALQCNTYVTKGNTDIDIDIDIDIEKDIDTEKEKEPKPEVVIMSQEESDYINELTQVNGYPLDRSKDIEYYHVLCERYPAIDILSVVKDWRINKLDKPLKKKDNPRSQINTWCKNSEKWGRNKKINKLSQQGEETTYDNW